MSSGGGSSSSSAGSKAPKGRPAKKDMTGNPLERFLRESKQFIELERQAEVDETESNLKSIPKKVFSSSCSFNMLLYNKKGLLCNRYLVLNTQSR
jgi:hypothetical protein